MTRITKARERLTVVAFALAVIAALAGIAFAVGYILGKILI
jgi:hypothetical protein